MRIIAFQAFFGSITKSLKLEVEANVLESGLSYCLEGTDKIQKIINPNTSLWKNQGHIYCRETISTATTALLLELPG